MQKLIIRDLFIYQKRNLLFIPFFAIFLVLSVGQLGQTGTQGLAISLIIIALFGVTMTTNTSFAYDESLKFNKYLRALPVTPKVIVLSRYASCLLSAITGTVFVLLFTLLANAVSGFYPSLEIYMTLGIGGFVMLIMALALHCGVLMPILFKFGYMKTKYPLMLLICVIAGSGPMVVSSTGVNKILNYAFSTVGMTGGYIIISIASLLVLFGSIKLSIWIFKKKEE